MSKNPNSQIINIEAEQLLLGTLIHEQQGFLYKEVQKIIPETFYDPIHGKIFQTISAMVNAGKEVNGITLYQRLSNEDGLAEVGGAKYIAFLIEECSNSITILPELANMLIGLAGRRALVALHEAGIANARITDGDNFGFEEPIAELEKGIREITLMSSENDSQSIGEAAEAFIHEQDDGSHTIIKTGFNALDDLIGGLMVSELVVVAGRPSMGKTAFTLAMQYNQSLDGQGTNFDSLEMDKRILVPRVQAMALKDPIAYERIIRKNYSREERYRLIAINETLRDLPFWVNFTNDRTIDQIINNLRRIKAEKAKQGHELKVAYIDYLGLIKLPQMWNSKREIELGKVTKALKNAARELGIAVVLLVQLSRKVEERDNKRPMLSDLAESGQIEMDADKVLFPFREFYYLERTVPKSKDAAEHQEKLDRTRNQIEIIVAKNRNGKVGSVKLGAKMAFNKFYDLDGHGDLI